MRLIATGLLVVMAVSFLAARELATVFPHPAWGFVIAFTEAAMVGGLADWFAVTALFRHPLGLPIPHTAIIPENKDRIADTMAVFLRTNFLTPAVVARRIHGFNLALAAGNMLVEQRRGGQSRLREGAMNLFADLLESLDQEQFGGVVKSGLRKQLAKLNLAPLLGQLLETAIADKRHLPVLEGLIRWAALTIEANEDLLRQIIHQRANALLRWTGLDDKVANAVLDGLYKLLAETLVVPDHPIRAKIEEGLETLAHALLHDPEMQERVNKLKDEVLANPAMAAWIDGMWERTRAGLLKAARNPQGLMSGGIGVSLEQLGKTLAEDAPLQFMVNRFARRTLVGAVSRYGDEIVRIVSETVKRWDAHTVTDRIEGAVGRDLQFIRINGTLVGGLVGVLIHCVDVLL
ncbi:DUF445 domain-containing protein [Novosphingobium sp. JCM 18896]|uniref:DUF445 domain-containing protein n=1 Tax=Novosphingobium sp. JCM 18896 TaxID=2989731 RepID=UPI002223A1DF|nr:DUF445 domain-containing protein [Novosphingobium sp. JCM 18896]MCW1429370.1 DUF445 domain-containing protein [Novosphingobium sp. JCM 18896]